MCGSAGAAWFAGVLVLLAMWIYFALKILFADLTHDGNRFLREKIDTSLKKKTVLQPKVLNHPRRPAVRSH